MTTHHPSEDEFDASDASLTRFDLVREGARRDGVEIVHYAPRFPVPGTRAERRVVRTILFLFTVAFLAGLAFVVLYIAWPWKWTDENSISRLYTPVLGLSLGLALFAVGFGLVTWGKKLLPEEVSIQDR